MHHLTCGINSLLHSVNLIVFTLLLVHLILRISPHHSHHLRSHHLSLPRPFTLGLGLKLVSFTNLFLHSHSYSFRTDFADLNLYCRPIKGALALFVLVPFFWLRVLDKAEYSAFESTLNSSIVSYRIVSYSPDPPRSTRRCNFSRYIWLYQSPLSVYRNSSIAFSFACFLDFHFSITTSPGSGHATGLWSRDECRRDGLRRELRGQVGVRPIETDRKGTASRRRAGRQRSQTPVARYAVACSTMISYQSLLPLRLTLSLVIFFAVKYASQPMDVRTALAAEF